MCGGKQSPIASTSRWKCMVAFGLPVVPEVNAIRQTSSAAVSTAANGAVVARQRGVEGVGAGAAVAKIRRSAPGCAGRRVRRAAAVAQHRVDLRLVDDRGRARARAAAAWSAPRSPPALITASKLAASHRVVGAAQQHAVAGDAGRGRAEHVGDAVRPRAQLGVGPGSRRAHAGSGARRGRARRGVEQLGDAVQALAGTAARAGRNGIRATGRAAAGGHGRRCRGAPRGIAASGPTSFFPVG